MSSTCDQVAERIALEVKQQLAAIGVEMAVEAADRETIQRRAGTGDFEAAIFETVCGPTMLRNYLIWHTLGPLNFAHFSSPKADAALDHIRYAESDDEYRKAVSDLQQAFMDDPPGMFLAWSVGTRAVSKRFEVQAEEGRDVLSTIRMWKPTGAQLPASRN